MLLYAVVCGCVRLCKVCVVVVFNFLVQLRVDVCGCVYLCGVMLTRVQNRRGLK